MIANTLRGTLKCHDCGWEMLEHTGSYTRMALHALHYGIQHNFVALYSMFGACVVVCDRCHRRAIYLRHDRPYHRALTKNRWRITDHGEFCPNCREDD